MIHHCLRCSKRTIGYRPRIVGGTRVRRLAGDHQSAYCKNCCDDRIEELNVDNAKRSANPQPPQNYAP